MMLRNVALGAVAALALAASAAQAQQSAESWVELMRQDVKTQKVAILTAVLDMDEATSEAFWPIYREFDLEDSKLDDQRLALIKEYAATYDNLDEMKSKSLSDQFFKLKDSRNSLRKKYFDKVKKATTTSLAARFMQAQNQMDLLIDLQIAQNLPLLEKGMEEMKAAPASSPE
jgi:hypothetical protein